MNKRKRNETTKEEEILPEGPMKKRKLDNVSEFDDLFTRGIEHFMKTVQRVFEADCRDRTSCMGLGKAECTFEDVYKIWFRFGNYYLGGKRCITWVYQNGGLYPKYQKKGFLTRLLPFIEDWCKKQDKIQAILFQNVIQDYLAKSLLKKGYARNTVDISKYAPPCTDLSNVHIEQSTDIYKYTP